MKKFSAIMLMLSLLAFSVSLLYICAAGVWISLTLIAVFTIALVLNVVVDLHNSDN